MTMEQHLSAKQLMKYLNISYPTLQRYKSDGLPYKKEGRMDRFCKVDVDEWMKERNEKDYMKIRPQKLEEATKILHSLTEAEQVEVIRSMIITRKEALAVLKISGTSLDGLADRKVLLEVDRGIILKRSVERRKQEVEKKNNKQRNDVKCFN